MNETDRELLAWAAKAAGLQIDHGVKIASGHLLVMCEGTPSFWNPIGDDGDALRLAVRLNIPVFPYEDETSTGTIGVRAKNWGSKEANTRRAIVRAAAEIGRNMK